MKSIGYLLILYISISLVLPSSVFALSKISDFNKMIEVEKLVWDKEHNSWNSMTYADPGDILRFKIIITYHDPDGKGPSYKIKWITIEDHLSRDLYYIGNATLKESSISNGVVIWENITDVELFDGDSLSLEYDVKILTEGIHTNTVKIKAFETCPHVWHNLDEMVTIYAMNYPAYRDRDVDDDSNNESAVDSNLDLRDGFEYYRDLDGSSRDIKTIDGDGDGKKDHFIDTDKDAEPDKYWDPDDDVLSDLELRDVDNDSVDEWIFDSDGDGIKDRYFDPDDDSVHLLDVNPPTVRIIKPEEGYIYRNNIKIRRSLSGTKIFGPINIKVEARDDSGIDRVEFYIDGKLKYVDKEEPYSWLWIAKPLNLTKEHEIEVKAYDIYGNFQTENITVIKLRSRFPIVMTLLVFGVGIPIEKLISKTYEEKSSQPPEEPPASINVPPVAVIDGPDRGYAGEKIIFNASKSYDPDGKVVSYKWNFGDGTKAEGETVSHVYKEHGRFKVTLEVADDEGKKDIAERYIDISLREGASPAYGFMFGVATLSLLLLATIVIALRGRENV